MAAGEEAFELVDMLAGPLDPQVAADSGVTTIPAVR
jgi:hypothetical protein